MRHVTDIDGRTVIKFQFHPRSFDTGLHAVEKEEGGIKRRYLAGVSSGLKPDLHGERMTEKAVSGFIEQANTGDVLLYEGQHGVNGTEDLGILSHAEVLPDGNWFTEYRLYDSLDGFDAGSATLERADKLWRQSTGVKPYKVAKQKGFSVEGHIPDGGIQTVTQDGKRVIDDVKLDGVVVVARPAYQDSMINAVFKALGEDAPWVVRKSIASRLREKLQQEELEESFFRQRWQISNALEEMTDEIMAQEGVDKANLLRIAFEEYADLMVDLLLRSQGRFETSLVENGHAPDVPQLVYGSVESLARQRRELLRQMTDTTSELVKSIKARGGP